MPHAISSVKYTNGDVQEADGHRDLSSRGRSGLQIDFWEASAVDSFSQSINSFLGTYYVPMTVLSRGVAVVKNTDM